MLRKGVRDFQPLAIPQQQEEKGYANDWHVSDKFDKRGFVVALDDENNVRYRHHDGQSQNREADRRAKDQYDPDDGFHHTRGQNKQAIVENVEVEGLHEVPLILRNKNLPQCRGSQFFSHGQGHK